jgi:hypothetical protein
VKCSRLSAAVACAESPAISVRLPVWRDLGQTEVEKLGMSALGDKDVRGLDVAVDDAFGVGGVEYTTTHSGGD